MAYKLVVSDLDGCLLHRDGRLPDRFKEAFELMDEQDVVFAAASGRSLAGVMELFEGYAGKMAFITDNGARVWYKGRMIAEYTLSYEEYRPLIEEFRRHENLLPVACGVNEAWIEDPGMITPEMEKELKKYYPSLKVCDFENIPEKVIKFALLYFDDIEKNIYPFFQKYDDDRLCVQVTAYVWIDIYKKGSSKGLGVYALQKELGVIRDETMAFGDYLNDISMAEYAGRSFAPSNAHPKVRECFSEVIGECEEESVAAKIIEILSKTDAERGGKR